MSTPAPPVVPAVPRALRQLRPGPRPGRSVVHRADVSSLEWAGLLRDGLITPVWGGAARVAACTEDPAVRVAALAALVPERGVIGRATAVWVHVGGPSPARADVLVRTRARRPDPHPDRRTHEAELSDADVLTIDGVRVTTVLRTALDVARWLPPAQSLPLLRALRDVGLDTGRAARAAASLHGGRGVRRARHVLAQVADERTTAGGGRAPGGAQARIAGSSAPRDPVIR
ncbi:hypothetical protein [Cellulomonas sp. HD19AZ1]|uniref:hypothetical protein n=1 Tax=Cellulomonas sp. HD19AZ1 TaxID=2559593 RepID=UPI0010713CD8|nr:hypothetical protein [Cellulomonas sp. HD19AZ1]TFH69569.1 hypothetical protein E4A51_16120 [Cellulomonas sp. HD19AZ1]